MTPIEPRYGAAAAIVTLSHLNSRPNKNSKSP
jgi:hypothetical protein